MRAESYSFVGEIWEALGGPAELLDKLTIAETGNLQSVYPVTEFASGAVAAASLSIAELLSQESAIVPGVTVDRRLSSFWFGMSIRPVGWTMPAAWDPIAGDYRTKDRWIRIHTNAPHHRAAAEHILGRHSDKAAMSRSVANWSATDLETAIIEAGGCAAEMRSLDEWDEPGLVSEVT